MAHLQSKRRLGLKRVYDVQTSTGNFFARTSGTTGLLVHNSHQLSKDALDALLKPLEDTMPGSEDKMLTCIFATTEPERMRATVLSRCAPAFVVRPQTPSVIAKRLQYICEQEGVSFDPEMLVLVAEITECHIRDALKAVEGVSMLGGITKENVTSYLHLDINAAYLELLSAIGTDLPAALNAARKILERASPTTCYQKLSEVIMLAFRVSLGESVPSYWGKEALAALGASHGIKLLGYASRFASRPGRPTAAMLMMDIAYLHHVGGSVTDPQMVISVQDAGPTPELPTTPQTKGAPLQANVNVVGTIQEQDMLWVDAQRGPAAVKQYNTPVRSVRSTALSPESFSEILGQTLVELGLGSGHSG